MIGTGRMPCEEGVVRGAAETPGCAERVRPWVLAATILGSSLAFIDGAVVNVALPVIQADLKTSVTGAQWVVNAYTLLLGALMLVGGAASDHLGRRRIFVAGIVVFTAASIGCGLAPSTVFLIAARAVQGIGGALLVPSSLAVISSAFPAAERGRAIGTWAGFSALTTALGPILGGWLVDALSGRAIFFINAPVALATLGLVFRHVPESRAGCRAGQAASSTAMAHAGRSSSGRSSRRLGLRSSQCRASARPTGRPSSRRWRCWDSAWPSVSRP